MILSYITLDIVLVWGMIIKSIHLILHTLEHSVLFFESLDPRSSSNLLHRLFRLNTRHVLDVYFLRDFPLSSIRSYIAWNEFLNVFSFSFNSDNKTQPQVDQQQLIQQATSSPSCQLANLLNKNAANKQLRILTSAPSNNTLSSSNAVPVGTQFITITSHAKPQPLLSTQNLSSNSSTSLSAPSIIKVSNKLFMIRASVFFEEKLYSNILLSTYTATKCLVY